MRETILAHNAALVAAVTRAAMSHTVAMPDGTTRRVARPSNYPAQARRAMRSRYMPHTGAKQRARCIVRDYEDRSMGINAVSLMPNYRTGGAIICTFAAHWR